MKQIIQIALIGLLVFMLISIRVFIQPYFYDPLIEYFKMDYLSKPIPEMNLKVFFLNIFYRYSLNSAISLAIIYLGFKNLKSIKFSFKIYVIAFVILCAILFILLNFSLNLDYKLIFYGRRFLIHPILLLVLLPAFYYQKLKSKNNNQNC
ncbi:exosortase F system-associated membrane protein [Lutibacter sp.]|uniref:exosortase F system-associated membrane protein n=1 Tax=Lutibacter sp. TaxID=1925666 RepID=UPI0038CD11E9